MKKLFYLASIIVAAALAVSCEPEPQGGDDITNASFTFSLRVTEVGVDEAKINVKHDGPEDVTWYGFVAEDTKSVNDLIAEKYIEFAQAGTVKDLKQSKNRTVTVKNLKSNTKYKYIVFAITEDAQLFNNVEAKSVDFTTVGFLLSQTEDWKVTRKGREQNQEKYSVEFGANATRCHIAFIEKWMVDYYESLDEIKEELDTYGGLRLQLGEDVYLFSILDYLVWEELYEYWGYYDIDKNFFEQETFNASAEFLVPRQESGDYYVVAIGFTNNGEPTLEYSSTLITIQKETASQEYSNWLGEWNITGANDITYKLRFEENDPNYSFYVYGWECGNSVHDKTCTAECTEHMLYTDFTKYALGIPFYFDALNGETIIKSKLIGAEELTEGYMYWGLYGYTDYQEQLVTILSDEDKIASAAQAVDGKATLNGLNSVTYNYDSEGNETEIEFTYNSFGYVMYDDKTFTPQPRNIPMDLPATLVKVEDTPKAASFNAKKARASKKEALARKSYNSIRKADYSRFTK